MNRYASHILYHFSVKLLNETNFFPEKLLVLFSTPGRSTWASHPHSSWHQRCQTLHSSWERRTEWRAASLQKTRNHLQPPEDQKETINVTYLKKFKQKIEASAIQESDL